MWWIPALVAVTIAAHHRWMVVARGQTSWKGGGFAMFSDATENDLDTRIYFRSDSEVASAEVVGLRHISLAVAIAIPTRKALAEWTQQVLSTDWFVTNGVAVPCHPRLQPRKVKADSASVTHRRVCFDVRSGGYRSSVVRTMTVPVPLSGEGLR